MTSQYEVGKIFTRFKASFIEKYHPPVYHLHVLNALEQCRTAALGGHRDVCPECGIVKISYNSCRNRHCPKCQGFEREKWIQARKEELLPVKYFHVVFTLPDALDAMGLGNRRIVYNALFHSAWDTVKTFARRQYGVQAGMIAVLHTWGSNLHYHPHLHCIVAAGGVTPQGRWKSFTNAHNNKPFLFPVKGMSRMFRAKFTACLDKELKIDEAVRKKMFKKKWVIYSKAPFAPTPKIVEYIGRYSHRVAITNRRITAVDEQHVSYTYKDYKDEGKTKTMRLTGEEFLRRFTQHILPPGFVKARHYGYLAGSNREKLRAIQKEFNLPLVPKKRKKICWSDFYIERHGVSPCLCRECGQAEMITIQTFLPLPTTRPPPSCVAPNTNLYRQA